eukprot:6204031-Alexandrium_andersonii.AAC.1
MECAGQPSLRGLTHSAPVAGCGLRGHVRPPAASSHWHRRLSPCGVRWPWLARLGLAGFPCRLRVARRGA